LIGHGYLLTLNKPMKRIDSVLHRMTSLELGRSIGDAHSMRGVLDVLFGPVYWRRHIRLIDISPPKDMITEILDHMQPLNKTV
jgi:hypothetical protein